MATILWVLIVVFNAAPVWAEYKTDPMTLIGTLEPVDQIATIKLPVPVCLDKMEAAMRAMDRYIFSAWTFDAQKRIIGAPIVIDPLVYLPVLRQWEEVKRDCWKQP